MSPTMLPIISSVATRDPVEHDKQPKEMTTSWHDQIVGLQRLRRDREYALSYPTHKMSAKGLAKNQLKIQERTEIIYDRLAKALQAGTEASLSAKGGPPPSVKLTQDVESEHIVAWDTRMRSQTALAGEKLKAWDTSAAQVRRGVVQLVEHQQGIGSNIECVKRQIDDLNGTPATMCSLLIEQDLVAVMDRLYVLQEQSKQAADIMMDLNTRSNAGVDVVLSADLKDVHEQAQQLLNHQPSQYHLDVVEHIHALGAHSQQLAKALPLTSLSIDQEMARMIVKKLREATSPELSRVNSNAWELAHEQALAIKHFVDRQRRDAGRSTTTSH